VTRRRLCIVCSQVFIGTGSRCPDHVLPARGRHYTKNALAVVQAATRCHLCGEGPRPGDPFVADHVVPRSLGGSDEIDNLRPAHRSCNGRRGNTTKAERNWRDRQDWGRG
jgi:5-methylcytosine-specific restriction endonuclease McrA